MHIRWDVREALDGLSWLYMKAKVKSNIWLIYFVNMATGLFDPSPLC